MMDANQAITATEAIGECLFEMSREIGAVKPVGPRRCGTILECRERAVRILECLESG